MKKHRCGFGYEQELYDHIRSDQTRRYIYGYLRLYPPLWSLKIRGLNHQLSDRIRWKIKF